MSPTEPSAAERPRTSSSAHQVGIAGVGIYVPSTFMEAAELAERSGLPEAVVRDKLGITRKPVPGPDDHTNAMGVRAARQALEQADIDASEIDVVLCTTEEWKEYPLFTAGIDMAHQLGADRAWAIDVQMRCATTMAALRMAKSLMIAEPDTRTVLVAGGYRNGDWVRYTDPSTRFLYGLGAGGGAIVLRKGLGRNALLGTAVTVDGSFARDVIRPGAGTVAAGTMAAGALGAGRDPDEADGSWFHCPDPVAMKERLDAVSMDRFLGVVDQALHQSGHRRSDIDYLNLLHMKPSAHRHILERLGLRPEQSCYLDRYGHVGQQDQAISILLGLETGRLRDGMLMVMVAAGIGYAWSASVVRWGAA